MSAIPVSDLDPADCIHESLALLHRYPLTSRYGGLHSMPIGLATSSSWRQPGFHGTSTRLAAAKLTPARVKMWYSTVVPTLLELLRVQGTRWRAIHLVKHVKPSGVMGTEVEDEEDKTPNLLWIGVSSETSIEEAEGLLAAVLVAMQPLDFGGLDVDIFVGSRRDLATSSSPFWGPNYFGPMLERDDRLPFLFGMGMAISPLSDPSVTGTAGLVLQEAGNPASPWYVLTSQHAMHPKKPDEERSAADAGGPGEGVIFAGDPYLAHLKKLYGRKEATLKSDIEGHVRDIERLQELADQGSSQAAESVRTVRTYQVSAEYALQRLRPLLADLGAMMGKQADRVIGNVHCHPRRVVGVSGLSTPAGGAGTAARFVQDWALVQLDPSALGEAPDASVIRLEWEARRATGKEFAKENLFKFRVSALADSADPFSGLGGLVVKRGAMSGARVGARNPVMSLTMADDDADPSWEIIVLNGSKSLWFEDLNRCERPVFSGPGDSGAAVVDHDGRVIGILTAGYFGTRWGIGKSDLSFVIPIAVVQEQLERDYGMKMELVPKPEDGRIEEEW